MSYLFSERRSANVPLFERNEGEVKRTGAIREIMVYKVNEIEQEQREICEKYETPFFPSEPNSKVGIALKTLGQKPINGLRHPPEGGTNGWYIWGGTNLSSDPDFFQPLHTEHLVEQLPEIVKFLGLPPGYRFLVAGSHLDVWYDPKLLHV